MNKLADEFGPIDIYIFDQLLRGRIHAGQRILDAGCGGGRNLVYLAANGFEVHAVDRDAERISAVSARFRLPVGERAHVAAVEAMPFPEDAFDVVLSNAVLHFAKDDAHFDAMLSEMLRVLASGGMLFARLASNIGIESVVRPLGDGRYRLPDGSDRYLVDEARLLRWTERCGGTLLDPLKTTNVQGQRCMTTWVLRVP